MEFTVCTSDLLFHVPVFALLCNQLISCSPWPNPRDAFFPHTFVINSIDICVTATFRTCLTVTEYKTTPNQLSLRWILLSHNGLCNVYMCSCVFSVCSASVFLGFLRLSLYLAVLCSSQWKASGVCLQPRFFFTFVFVL